MKNWKITLIILFSFVLHGCTSSRVNGKYPVYTKDTDTTEYPGPLIVNGKRPSILGGCYTNWATYGGGCDLLFVDSNGHQQHAYRIANELDAFGAKLEPMKPWVKLDYQRTKSLPYEMFLLTISPEIVLIVPREKDPIKSCGAVVIPPFLAPLFGRGLMN